MFYYMAALAKLVTITSFFVQKNTNYSIFLMFLLLERLYVADTKVTIIGIAIAFHT